MTLEELPPMPMTPKEVADLCHVGVRRIYREIEAGRLKAHHKRGQTRGWYMTRQDLEEWIVHGMLEE